MAPVILLVEDDELLRNKLQRDLVRLGYQVCLAEGGSQAIAVLKQQECDLVITDIFMPDMDGYELILHLIRQHPELRIVAMSGGSRAMGMSGNMTLDAAKAMGVYRILEKPVSFHQLETLLNQAFPA